jgi:lipopolysaccharide export system protein LptA
MLTAKFEPGTKYLQSIHVQKKASMTAEGGSSAARNELQADEIRLSFRQVRERTMFDTLRADGSVRWVSKPLQSRPAGRQEPARVLTASSLGMIYAKEGESFESGNAVGGVVVSENRSTPDIQSETRRLLADRVQFHFFAGNNRLRDMDADGHVQMMQERKARPGAKSAVDNFRTSSEKMRVVFFLQNNESAVETMTQWGNFKYEDASMSATAGRCDYDARVEKLVMRESPRITDAMNSTTGEWMEYEQTPGLLSVHGRVRSVLNTGKGKESFFTLSSSSSSPALVTADEMRYWKPEQRARYTGEVQLLSENGQLQAGTLDITENGERVEAQNAIRHFIPQRAASEPPARTDKTKEGKKSEGRSMMIKASHLKYIRGNNSIAYWGSVVAHSDDIVMSSESLDVLIAAGNKSVEHATARGRVTIRQGSRVCKGDTADYFLDPQKFVLLGNPAEVDDPDKGKSYAGRLTSFIADDRILLENQ